MLNQVQAQPEVLWQPGDVVRHTLAEGLVLEVQEVLSDGEHLRAKVLRKGDTDLWEGYVLTFRAEFLVPSSD